MEVQQVLKELKQGKRHPVYLLHGEEPYYIDLISDYIEANVLEEAHKGFDQTVLYGKDTDLITLVNAARRFPMLATHQVLLVKEAQTLKWRGEEEDALVKYLENPMQSTILVLAYKYGKFDKRKKVYKALDKSGIVVESSKLRDDKMGAWIMDYLASQDRPIQPQAAYLIAEFLGTDLSKVVNEIDKMILNMQPGQIITPQEVERHIGISKEYNSFELQTALGKRDALKAYRIVDYFAANPRNNPMPLVVASLATYFTKLLKYHYLPDRSQQAAAKELGVHPFFVKDYDLAARYYSRPALFRILHELHQVDLLSKGVGGSVEPAQLLKDMVNKILMAR
jgi:DNA polymerase-3 subunit delta